MQHRSRAAIVAGLSLTALLAACGGGQGGSDPQASGGGEATVTQPAGVEGGTVSLRGCNPQNPLIGASTNETCGGDVIDAVTAGLVHYNADTAAPENDIAEAIETTDNQNFTVKIKPGYKYSDGTEVKAKDFVDAWNWAAYGPNAQLNAYFFEPIAGFADLQAEGGATPAAKEMSGLKLVDDYTFTIQTSQPVSNLPVRLGYPAFAPMPPSAFTDLEAYGKKPVTAGPFMVESWTPNRDIVLTKNPNYTGQYPPHVDGATFRIYQDTDAAYKDIQAGNLDATNDIPQSAMLDQKYKRDFPEGWLSEPVGTNQTITFAPAQTDPTVQNPKLRQALSMAIDRDTISQQIFSGARVPATGWVSPTVDGYAEGACGEFCTYNPERAKQLLGEAGGYSGTLTLSYNADSDHGPWTTAVCNNINQNLGINCVATPVVDFKTFRDQITQKEMKGAFRTGWQMDYPSIENFLSPLYRTNASSNDGEYSNPAFDAKLDEAAAAPDLSQANTRYQEAEKMLANDMPSVPMFDYVQTVVWGPKVTNVKMTPKGTVDLTTIQTRG